jgi:RNA polymerase sigma-70 factor (ECF subfamily)
MMDPVQTDTELFLSFKSGDIHGFNALFNRHWSSLFHLSKKILEDDDLAKDVVQETFVSFYQTAAGKDILNVRSYLLQCVKYQCFMQLRSGRISEKHLSRLQLATVSNAVDEYMDEKELQKILHDKIESLPEKCREVFYLSRYESLSNQKIAEHLNISQKTVEHQITKALKTLRLSVDKLALISWFLIS